jgi:hypothetical protein
MRLRADRWAELVSAWEASGQTAQAFAATQGIAESSLRWWKTELLRRARRRAPRRSPGPHGRGGTRPVTLARVVREDEVVPTATIEVQLAGARLSVGRGFDAELLREVVRALSAGG